MRHNKYYRGKLTKREKDIKIKKFLSFILTLSVLFTGYWGFAFYQPEYSQAEVIINRPTDENIQDRLWNDLDNYNFTLHEKINTMNLIGNCENKQWDIDAKYNNGNSVDRGLFMINDKWHAEVSNACAYNYSCALKEFVRIYRERGWNEWSCGKILNLK